LGEGKPAATSSEAEEPIIIQRPVLEIVQNVLFDGVAAAVAAFGDSLTALVSSSSTPAVLGQNAQVRYMCRLSMRRDGLPGGKEMADDGVGCDGTCPSLSTLSICCLRTHQSIGSQARDANSVQALPPDTHLDTDISKLQKPV